MEEGEIVREERGDGGKWSTAGNGGMKQNSRKSMMLRSNRMILRTAAA